MAKQKLNIVGFLVLGFLLLGLLYILEVNTIIQDSFRAEEMKRHLRKLSLENQSLESRSDLRMNTEKMEEIKVRFSLTEVKTFTYLAAKSAQFSLKGYPYE